MMEDVDVGYTKIVLPRLNIPVSANEGMADEIIIRTRNGRVYRLVNCRFELHTGGTYDYATGESKTVSCGLAAVSMDPPHLTLEGKSD